MSCVVSEPTPHANGGLSHGYGGRRRLLRCTRNGSHIGSAYVTCRRSGSDAQRLQFGRHAFTVQHRIRAIKAGSKIDVPSPERTMTAEEKEMLQQIADSFHARFRDDVTSQRRRSIPSEQLDGRIMTGEQALKIGLIDQVGYLDDAIAWIAQKLHYSSSQLQVVMLRRDNDRAFTALDATPNTPLQSSLIPLRLPGLDRSSLPTFLYLWQPDPSLVTAVGG